MRLPWSHEEKEEVVLPPAEIDLLEEAHVAEAESLDALDEAAKTRERFMKTLTPEEVARVKALDLGLGMQIEATRKR
jgi:hypothetical protein